MEERSSPLISQVGLWIAFAFLVVVSIVTVLVPELSSDTPEQEDEQEQAEPPSAPAP